jgi:hypothetical protein
MSSTPPSYPKFSIRRETRRAGAGRWRRLGSAAGEPLASLANGRITATASVEIRQCRHRRRPPAHGLESPTGHVVVKTVWTVIRCEHSTAAQGKAPPLTADIRAMVDQLGAGLLDVRDRALLLVGFLGALHRSEIVSFDAGDIVATGEGLVVTLHRSKNDQ